MVKKRGKNISKKNRHPMGKKGCRKDSPSLIVPLKSKVLNLLRCLSANSNERFNIRQYSIRTGIPRPSVYDMLNKLITLDYVENPHLGSYRITRKGKHYSDVTLGDVGNFRRECRDSANLSTHYLRFFIPETSRKKFSESKIKLINPMPSRNCPKGWKRVDNPNLTQYYIYFEDATIIISPKKVSLRLHDILSSDTEEAIFKATMKALEYLKKINKIGIEADTVQLESGDFARVNSLLAESLSKIDKRYFIELPDGGKFWIDHSPPNDGEDETNKLELRERLDDFMKDMFNSEALLSDVDKQKEVVGMLLKLKIVDTYGNKVLEKIEEKQQMPKTKLEPKERANYFG